MEKIKLERMNKTTKQVETIEIYSSYSNSRLDDETFEEYKIRRSVIKHLEKLKKKRRTLEHVSSELIPLMNDKQEVVLIQGKPIWIGKTKGKTLIKNNKENE
jgi:hypothetical protein